MRDLLRFLFTIPAEAYLGFFFFSLLFYDALIPETNFKVFKEKIFLKLSILSLAFFYVGNIKNQSILYMSTSFLAIQIFYSLYNRKKFQAWRMFDLLCVVFGIGVSLLVWDSLFMDLLFSNSVFLALSSIMNASYFLDLVIVESVFYLFLGCCMFFAFKFSQRFYFYLKERKLRRALKKKTKEDLSNQEAQKEGYKQKNLEEKSNE